MRRALWLVLAICLVAGGLTGAVVAAVGDAPIATGTIHDPAGDAGSGPDISALTVTINANQTASLAITLSNRSSVGGDESVQFFVTTPAAGNVLNIAQFGDGSPTMMSTWNGTSWDPYHEVSGSWSSSTFTTTIPLSDLQDALKSPVRPVLSVNARSYTNAGYGATPVQVDAVPDTGYLPVSTITATPPTTTAAHTTTTAPTKTAPAPPPHSTASGPKGLEPAWNERIVRLPHARIEWTRLAFSRLPISARISIACTKGCSLSETLHAVRGTATSRRFVNHPFSAGQVFLTKVLETNGAGWWTQITIIAKPGGQEFATRDGCYLTDGTSVPDARC